MYQALYRKYRPIDFDSVVGQESLVRTLKNSIINNSFSHAYMFFGPRGTGKTTLSKIFARAVNCLNPIDGNACGKCSCCLNSYEKECVDIIEIDAASNNGVDEIRELKNKISLVPANLKFKVYIIDEVHMLSLGAFNALLKTLEEPPEHAIFILATTDPQKVPETIISRCQCFSFKRISNGCIVKRLRDICKMEKISISDEVLNEIASASEGGMRDALGLLDKLRSFTNGEITVDDFIELNGLITKDNLKELVDSIMQGDNTRVLQLISSYNENGKNLIQIMSQFMNYLRNIIVSYYVDNIIFTYDIDNLIKLVNTINEKMFDIKKSGNPNIYIEMLLLKFMNDYTKNTTIDDKKNISREIKTLEKEKTVSLTENFKTKQNIEYNNKIEDIQVIKSIDKDNNDDQSDNSKNNDKVEEPVKNINTSASMSSTVDNTNNDNDIVTLRLENLFEIMKARVNNTLAMADKQILKNVVNSMNVFNDYTFDNEIGYIACSLLDGKVRAASEDSIILSYYYDSIVKQNLLELDKITDVFNRLTNLNKKIAIITDDDWEKEKSKYIQTIKNGQQYTVIEEPEMKVFEGLKENDIISNSAMELFGDIVEME